MYNDTSMISASLLFGYSAKSFKGLCKLEENCFLIQGVIFEKSMLFLAFLGSCSNLQTFGWKMAKSCKGLAMELVKCLSETPCMKVDLIFYNFLPQDNLILNIWVYVPLFFGEDKNAEP